MRKAKKWIIRALGALLVAAVTGVGLVWHFSGFGPSASRAEERYKRFEEIGIPLDADAFGRTQEVPASENASPQLDALLAEFSEFQKSRPKSDRPVELSVATLADAKRVAKARAEFELSRPIVDRILPVLQKPFFRPNLDWADPFKTSGQFMISAKDIARTMRTGAALAALDGDRARARQLLRGGFDIARLVPSAPFVIDGLVQIALRAIAQFGVVMCINIDPKGAAEYAKIETEIEVHPFPYYLRGEAFFCLTSIRNTEPTKLLWPNEDDFDFAPPDESETASSVRTGVPSHPIQKAVFSRAAELWLPIVEQINADGSLKDRKAFEVAMATAGEVHRSRRWIDRVIGTSFPVWTTGEQAHVRSENFRLLGQAYAKVVQYHNDHGKWPESLAACGVQDADLLSPTRAPFGYRKAPGGFRVWSVGLDGIDDGGSTREEMGEHPSELAKKGHPVGIMDDVFEFVAR